MPTGTSHRPRAEKIPLPDDKATVRERKHHVCEDCFRSSPEFNPGFGPLIIEETCSGHIFHFSYAWRSGHRAETLRVVSTSPERLVLRVIPTEGDAPPEEWVFLTSLF